ncbi:MAG TPA: uracil-DNA glycosylase family protein [Leptospiraceae bacterium]|nr:uracil-DNA glycosylase family protein [Leptospiraceae bacterium]HMY67622.1 uracil-DNA glycosylase family protein [Leptospiraceae bacterium]HNF14782.1 uracil-DNA glycosylase family protein [Leptospiraceae bacterium]HNF25144.1 uracil-DNA glycosylase family protein [Leptospiraceae bacterium]HNI28801.1 uracil-DNA glycosylase family protein [Leptospiraceae bacterium]
MINEYKDFRDFRNRLASCTLCSKMQGPVIIGSLEKKTGIISIGQAPGIHEKEKMMPFSYTAGKTLFKWLSQAGIEEKEFRAGVNMSAVCRCFPGKEKSGDRKPDREEIQNCSSYLEFEFRYHEPRLVIPIGKLAVENLSGHGKFTLNEVIGKKFNGEKFGLQFDWIALPHPSGLNAWNHSTEGRRLLEKSLELISKHEEIQILRRNSEKSSDT